MQIHVALGLNWKDILEPLLWFQNCSGTWCLFNTWGSEMKFHWSFINCSFLVVGDDDVRPLESRRCSMVHCWNFWWSEMEFLEEIMIAFVCNKWLSCQIFLKMIQFGIVMLAESNRFQLSRISPRHRTEESQPIGWQGLWFATCCYHLGCFVCTSM